MEEEKSQRLDDGTERGEIKVARIYGPVYAKRFTSRLFDGRNYVYESEGMRGLGRLPTCCLSARTDRRPTQKRRRRYARITAPLGISKIYFILRRKRKIATAITAPNYFLPAARGSTIKAKTRGDGGREREREEAINAYSQTL